MHHPCDENGRKILKMLSAPKKETDLCPFLSASHILPQNVGRSALRPARHHSDRDQHPVAGRSSVKDPRKQKEERDGWQRRFFKHLIRGTCREPDRLLSLLKRPQPHPLMRGTGSRISAKSSQTKGAPYRERLLHSFLGRMGEIALMKDHSPSPVKDPERRMEHPALILRPARPRSPDRPCPRISQWRHEHLHRSPAGISVF